MAGMSVLELGPVARISTTKDQSCCADLLCHFLTIPTLAQAKLEEACRDFHIVTEMLLTSA